MKIGYARISTTDQNLDLQMDALRKAGCEEIFTDKASGSKEDRPGLRDVFRHLREGDTLVVWKLDRLGRSVKHLIELLQNIDDRKASFWSLQDNVDTNTSIGKMMFHVIGALAEFERNLIKERTSAGLKAARERGVFGGRRIKCTDKQIERIKQLSLDLKIRAPEICKMFNISKQTYYNYINA